MTFSLQTIQKYSTTNFLKPDNILENIIEYCNCASVHFLNISNSTWSKKINNGILAMLGNLHLWKRMLTYLGIKHHNVYSLVSNGWAKNNTHIFTDKANTTRCQQILNLEDHDMDVHSISNFLYVWNCLIIKKSWRRVLRCPESSNSTREK